MDEYQQTMAADEIIDLNVNESDRDLKDHRFSQDEDNMLDFKGKMIDPKYWKRVLLVNDEMEDKYKISMVNVLHEDDQAIKKISQQSVNDEAHNAYLMISVMIPSNQHYCL